MADFASLYIKVDSSGVVTASKDLNKLTGHSRNAEKATDSLNAGFGRLKGMLAGLATAYAGLQMARFVSETIQAQVTMERMTVALKSATGSAQAAADSMAYVRSESQRLGLSLQDQGKAYTKLASASKGTSLEGKATQDIFTAISEASTALSLSADESAGALYAIGQMMSKGTVQAEELRGQLGERLPGAFQVAAKAMGVSTAELGKMLEQGQVMADDFLPKFAAALRQHYSGAIAEASQSTSANLNRMKTAIFEAKVAIGEAFGSSTQNSVKAMTTAIEKMKAEMETPEAKQAISDLSREFEKLIVNAGEKAPAAIKSTIKALEGIMAFYNALPSFVVEAAGMGIIGRMLFGVGPGKIIAAIAVINAALEKLNMNIGSLPGKFNEGSGAMQNIIDVIAGKRDWNTGALKKGTVTGYADVAGLAKAEAALLGQAATTPKTETTTGTGTGTKKAADALKRLNEQYAKLIRKQRQELELAGLDGLNKTLRENEIKYEDAIRAAEKFSGAQKKELIDLAKAVKAKDDWNARVEYSIKLGELEKEAEREAEKEREEAIKRQIEAEKQLHAGKIFLINSQLYELDLAEQAGTSWRDLINERIRLTQQLLDIESGKLKSMPEDATNDDWRAQQRSVQELQSRMIAFKNLNQTLTGSFTEGWDKAWRDWNEHALTAFTGGQELATQTAQAMQDSFSTIFFDMFENDLDSFSDYFRSFARSINKIFADMLARMLTEWLTSMSMMKLQEAGASLLSFGASLLGAGIGAAGAGASAAVTTPVLVANGGIFSGGQMVAFANGGVVNRPTFFPMANGTGLMGEAGPEAVMPLKRGKDGKLGVAASSGVINIPLTVNGGSKKQAAELRRDLERFVEQKIRSWS